MDRFARIAGALLLGLFATSAALPQQAPRNRDPALPPSIPGSFEPEYSLASPPVEGLKLGTYTIHFGETALQDVAQRIGAGAVQEHQPHSYWLCYQWRSPFPSYQIWLLNDVFSKSVGAAILKGGTVPAEANCAELPAEFRNISLLNGLALEGNPEAIGPAIGRRVHIPNVDIGQAGFVYRDVVPGCGGGGASVRGILRVEWRDRSIHSLVAQLDRGSC